jgi:hypothetical protein
MYVSATIVLYAEVYCTLRNKRSVRHTVPRTFVSDGCITELCDDYKIQCKRKRKNRNGCVSRAAGVELAAQDWKFLDKHFEEYLIIYSHGVKYVLRVE